MSKYRHASPTEDNSLSATIQMRPDDKNSSTLCGETKKENSPSSSTATTTATNLLQWPDFADIPDVLDFKTEVAPKDRLIALLTYILRENDISSINVVNINYMLSLFYRQEHELLEEFKDKKKTLHDPKVQEHLRNRLYIANEIRKELRLPPSTLQQSQAKPVSLQ